MLLFIAWYESHVSHFQSRKKYNLNLNLIWRLDEIYRCVWQTVLLVLTIVLKYGPHIHFESEFQTWISFQLKIIEVHFKFKVNKIFKSNRSKVKSKKEFIWFYISINDLSWFSDRSYLFVSRRMILRRFWFSFWSWSFNTNGFFPGILGFHVIGAASILIEHVWADRTVSRTAMRRFLAFWISDVTESNPETTSSPATDSTSCLTLARTFNWCWSGSILSTWFVSCSANRLSVHSAAMGRATDRSFLP